MLLRFSPLFSVEGPPADQQLRAAIIAAQSTVTVAASVTSGAVVPEAFAEEDWSLEDPI